MVSHLEGKEDDAKEEMSLSLMTGFQDQEKPDTISKQESAYDPVIEEKSQSGFIAISKEVAEQPKIRIDRSSS